MQLRDWFFGLFGRRARHEDGGLRKRGPATHVIILDGTQSTLDTGHETNAGITFKLLSEASQAANMTIYYEAGIQWRDWASTWDVMTGKGINRQIKRAYGVVASRYRVGDQIILVGYSRGAYAVRSLAGVIDVVGLLKHDCATERAITQAYRHYRLGGRSKYARAFRDVHCHPDVQIEAVAVWDTVKALGLRMPIVWRWFARDDQDFHSHALGPHVRNGFHALGIDERREAYAPVLWTTPEAWRGRIEQVWFRGNHGDVGGQVGGHLAARPLANIPLIWMLERLEMCGVLLPQGWQTRFVQDVNAPSIGNWRGWSKIFLYRRRRLIGRDGSESLHDTVADRQGQSTLRQFHDQTSG
ncbi:DUF2235 domain-containing protein [Yoonia sediminilitoris]|uniref:Putative alpha/beta hydrolase family protein DUF2235 n=1 Tax=Yoonia sediminilitoris TaxID=1286148 RepID=A0A2T6KJM9_9RHOB|nr:DUF2235 domain-containing protein [Yoonia sediminilitoris]PUB16173.1 putative alpha/beta hydrolase family protein DUF2235 [Yoonia sediminilitoris]RCW96522.1 putative alpha/beta hydrolase family protein DUF2235 [Yoonia sediminilitoris]